MALNVAELYRLFLREREFLSNCSPKTIRSYQQAWNAFASFLEPVEAVGCIRPAIKRGVVEKMSTGRLTPGSVNVYLRAINAFLNWGHREEHFVDRIKPVELLKVTKRLVPSLSPAEVQRLVRWKASDFPGRRVHTMACLVLDTGLRIDECLHVEKRDVDLENFLLTVRHGKGDKERKVPLSLDGRNVLYRYLKLSKDSPYPLVFCTRNGTVLTHRNAERDLKRIGADIGVRLRWHLLRHTFGSLFIRNGGNVADLKRILGHASISTTMGYVHAQAEDFVAAHNGLSPLAKASRR